jgi:hypothetical protein
MDPTPKRRMLKEKTPDVLARSHPNSRARGAKKILKANWLPQETMRIRKPATTMSQPGENIEESLFLFLERKSGYLRERQTSSRLLQGDYNTNEQFSELRFMQRTNQKMP